MNTVEFQANIRNGKIEIPEPYRQAFEQQTNVKVILIKQIEKPKAKNILELLLENPLSMEGFTSLTRDEIYER